MLTPDQLKQLTDPQLKVVEGVFVDLLDALVQRDGEVGQRAQVTPLIFTLLLDEEKTNQINSPAGTAPPTCEGLTCFSGDRPETAM